MMKKEERKMSLEKGYDYPSVDFIESEELPEYTPPQSTIYGIVGATVMGPYEPTSIGSIKELHRVFGYGYLGLSSKGERVISQAITAAERILQNTNHIIFQRVLLKDSEKAKFRREDPEKLSYTIANNNGSIQSITVNCDGVTVSVVAEEMDQYGSIQKRTLVKDIDNEEELKVALEFEETLVDVTVPEGYIAKFATTEEPAQGEEPSPVAEGGTEVFTDVYAPNFDLINVAITDEISQFENADSIDVSVLIAPMGTIIEATCETDEDIEKAYDDINMKLVDCARERSDCFMAGMDYPMDYTYDQWIRKFGSAPYSTLDCDQTQTCFPCVKVKNAYTGDIVEASASMIVAKQMAYTDDKKKCWFAPAGFGDNKGVITDCVSINYALTKPQRKKVVELRGNCVLKFVGQGVAFWGNTTYKMKPKYGVDSFYSQISIRRLVNYIRKLVIYVSLITLFEPNDTLTWKKWKANINPKLREIKENRGIEDYKVIMDRTTISDEDILNGRAPAMIYVKPIGAIEYIPVNFVLTSNNVYFEGEEEEE